MEVVSCIIILIAFGTMSAIIKNSINRKKINQANAIANQANAGIPFTTTTRIENLIEIDENRKLFKIPMSAFNTASRIYKYSDILKYELFQNDALIETSGKGGNALIGGVLFGATGAIIGANIGKKRSTKIINSLKIKITLNNLQTPSLFINCISSPLSMNSQLYQSRIEIAQKILSTLNVMQNSIIKAEDVSNIEEVKKYKELFDVGAITQEEFEKKKKELLKL